MAVSDEKKSGAKDSADAKTPDKLAQALSRLNASLDTLAERADDVGERASKTKDADETIQAMSDDRSALARELDSQQARAERLAQVNSDVSRRLVGAMEMVRGVLDQKPQ